MPQSGDFQFTAAISSPQQMQALDNWTSLFPERYAFTMMRMTNTIAVRICNNRGSHDCQLPSLGCSRSEKVLEENKIPMEETFSETEPVNQSGLVHRGNREHFIGMTSGLKLFGQYNKPNTG